MLGQEYALNGRTLVRIRLADYCDAVERNCEKIPLILLAGGYENAFARNRDSLRGPPLLQIGACFGQQLLLNLGGLLGERKWPMGVAFRRELVLRFRLWKRVQVESSESYSGGRRPIWPTPCLNFG
jgi:hypothetical protein